MKGEKQDPQLSEISGKLDTLIRLYALNMIRNVKTQKEQIELLSDAGFRPKQIADILDTSRNVVDVTLHSIRKEKKRKKTKEESSTKKDIELKEVELSGAENVEKTDPVIISSTIGRGN